ncbi:hypothetical protein H9P43_000736 [Blastocladiella emersonii ATCC 22665]|nr:hypothetical protein H9P43_000736 [Blastocladiella emersonii ATCC 22665]
MAPIWTEAEFKDLFKSMTRLVRDGCKDAGEVMSDEWFDYVSDMHTSVNSWPHRTALRLKSLVPMYQVTYTRIIENVGGSAAPKQVKLQSFFRLSTDKQRKLAKLSARSPVRLSLDVFKAAAQFFDTIAASASSSSSEDDEDQDDEVASTSSPLSDLDLADSATTSASSSGSTPPPTSRPIRTCTLTTFATVAAKAKAKSRHSNSGRGADAFHGYPDQGYPDLGRYPGYYDPLPRYDYGGHFGSRRSNRPPNESPDLDADRYYDWRAAPPPPPPPPAAYPDPRAGWNYAAPYPYPYAYEPSMWPPQHSMAPPPVAPAAPAPAVCPAGHLCPHAGTAWPPPLLVNASCQASPGHSTASSTPGGRPLGHADAPPLAQFSATLSTKLSAAAAAAAAVTVSSTSRSAPAMTRPSSSSIHDVSTRPSSSARSFATTVPSASTYFLDSAINTGPASEDVTPEPTARALTLLPFATADGNPPAPPPPRARRKRLTGVARPGS